MFAVSNKSIIFAMENKKRLNMEKSIVKYLGNFRVEATYEASGQTLKTDAGKASGGLGEYATPVDILAQSLAACTLTTIAMRTERLLCRQLTESTERLYFRVRRIEL